MGRMPPAVGTPDAANPPGGNRTPAPGPPRPGSHTQQGQREKDEPMNDYSRTVSAALAETGSKFKLAEALALDIPSRQRGRHGADVTDVSEYMEAARRAILDAGGEPKAVRTLTNYRTIALWVKDPVKGNFRWISGASFTAHREACGAGMSYDDFVAMPSKKVRDIVPSKQEIALRDVKDWPSARKAEVARELLADPEVAEQIEDAITDHVAASPVRTAHVISKRRESLPPTRQPEVDDLPERPKRDYDAMVEQWVNLASITFAAESSGKWKPNDHSEALLYFISQIIGDRREPTGKTAEFVNEKLESLFSEAEAYANSQVS